MEQLSRFNILSENSLDKIEKCFLILFFIFLPFHTPMLGYLIPIAIIKPITLALILIWFYKFLFDKRVEFKHVKAFYIFAVFVLACFLSSLFSPVIPEAGINNLLFKLFNTIKPLFVLCFLYLGYLNLTKEKLYWSLHCLTRITSILSVLAFILLLLHLFGIWPNNFTVLTAPLKGYVRLRGWSTEPQNFGAYLLLVLPIYFINLLRGTSWGFNFKWNLFFLLVALINLFYTFSLGAISAFVCLIIILAFSNYKTILRQWKLLLITLLIIFCTIVVIKPIQHNLKAVIKLKTAKSQNSGLKVFSSLNVRLDFWKIAIREFNAYPIFGVGPEAYGYFFDKYRGSLINKECHPQPPQNFFIGMLANTGIVGIVPFILFFIFLYYKFFLIQKINSNSDKSIYWITFLVITTILITRLSYWSPWAPDFWFFVFIGLWHLDYQSV